MSNSAVQTPPREIDPVLWEAEFTQAMEMYRSNSTVTIQVLTVLVVADVTLLGFAFERHSAVILFLTGFLPIAGLMAYYRMGYYMKPVIYASLLLENRFRPPSGDLLATSLIGMQTSGDTFNKIVEIAEDQDFERRMQRLAQLRMGNDRRRVQGVARTLIVTAAVLQFVGAVVLGWIAGWSWFG